MLTMFLRGIKFGAASCSIGIFPHKHYRLPESARLIMGDGLVLGAKIKLQQALWDHLRVHGFGTKTWLVPPRLIDLLVI